MSILSRIFGAPRHVTPRPTGEQVAAVDVPGMLELARARGDRRSDDEIAAALVWARISPRNVTPTPRCATAPPRRR